MVLDKNDQQYQNLCIFKHSILESFNIQSQTEVIYTDMEKAFNRLNHKLLINNLKTYGFTEPLISWFYSFFTNRTQIVKYENYLSEQITNKNDITLGIPQGDHLSSILFCLFINNISIAISHLRILLLADDKKIYKDIKCLDDAIIYIYEWCPNNDLFLNLNKCSKITFSF